MSMFQSYMQYVHVSSVVVVHGDPTRRMYMCMSSSKVEARVAMRNRCASLWSFELHVLQPIVFLIRVAKAWQGYVNRVFSMLLS